MSDSPAIEVHDNKAENRFEAKLGDDIAVAEYERSGDTITFTHTLVPEAFQGQGVAGKLVRTALDQARSEGLHVVPQCPYVARFIERHPEYQDLTR